MECTHQKFVLTNAKPLGRPMEKIDETLVKKAQTGDIKAFEEIFKKNNELNFLPRVIWDAISTVVKCTDMVRADTMVAVILV